MVPLSPAAFASLRSILLVELLGLEKLTNAFGLLLLFQGIAGIFGSPVAGMFAKYIYAEQPKLKRYLSCIILVSLSWCPYTTWFTSAVLLQIIH